MSKIYDSRKLKIEGENMVSIARKVCVNRGTVHKNGEAINSLRHLCIEQGRAKYPFDPGFRELKGYV